MQYLILLIPLALIILFLYIYFKGHTIPKNTFTFFSGSNGSGKSYLSCVHLLRTYRYLELQRFIKNIFISFKNLFLPKANKVVHQAKTRVFSNIPLAFKQFDVEYLDARLLFLENALPQKCIVFIDELGDFASQWDYGLDIVKNNFDQFLRYFRHFTKGGYIIANDQTIDNIAKCFRSRLGTIYYLYDFKMILPVCKLFYIVNFKRLLNQETSLNEIIDSNESIQPTLKKSYFFGFHTIYKCYNTYAHYSKYKDLKELSKSYFTDTYTTQKFMKTQKFHNNLTYNKDIFTSFTKKELKKLRKEKLKLWKKNSPKKKEKNLIN